MNPTDPACEPPKPEDAQGSSQNTPAKKKNNRKKKPRKKPQVEGDSVIQMPRELVEMDVTASQICKQADLVQKLDDMEISSEMHVPSTSKSVKGSQNKHPRLQKATSEISKDKGATGISGVKEISKTPIKKGNVTDAPKPIESKSKAGQKKSSMKTKSKTPKDKGDNLVEEEAKERRKANAEDALAKMEELTGISLRNPPQELVLRPHFKSGSEGRKVPLLTNFFRLALRGRDVFRYQITFERADDAAVVKEAETGRQFKRITKKIFQQLLAKFVSTAGQQLFRGKAYAFDGDRILITNGSLAIPLDGQNFRFQFDEFESAKANTTPISYSISIKPVKNHEPLMLCFDSILENRDFVNDRAVLQVIDIIAKAYAFQNHIVYGSKIFFPASIRPRITMNIQRGREDSTPFELAFGYHQSTLFCQGGPMQNIDRATAVLYREGPLIDRVVELIGRAVNDPRPEIKTLDMLKEFCTVRVETNYRAFPSRHTIRSFSRTSCRETYFGEGATRKSVEKYFMEQYGIRLRYPNLPCVEYGPSKYLPIEVCKILPDQRNQKKLREDIIRILTNHATTQKPVQRANETEHSAKSIAQQNVLKDFGIQLTPKMIEIQGRILPSPKLKYAGGKVFEPVNPGDWNMQQPDKKRFLTSSGLSIWALMVVECRSIDSGVAQNFSKRLSEIGDMVGLRVASPLAIKVSIRRSELRANFEKFKNQGAQLIVCIMPEYDDLYTAIKSIGDRLVGVPTQIVLDKHYNPRFQNRQKMFDVAYLSNLLLKINSKIGGINLGLADNCKPKTLNELTMVVGIDVNHPSPGDNSPSIAAVVGSLNSEFATYHSNIRINESRDEIVQVSEMMKPILDAFKYKRGSYPDNIIVYRDGVSEGQFAYVLAYEIFPLRETLSKLVNKRVKLTYIIVQKRHNARFFPKNPQDSTRSGNILPGCVVDTEICHYKWFDFYLCSQNSFLGTARPGKYTVLWDEISMTANELQKVTYYLCYLFARSTKSIADPAPARYAHHLAARGKVYLKDLLRDKSGNAKMLNQELTKAINVVDSLKNVLYFI